MALILELKEAIREFVRDGDVVAMEGFTHLIPSAAGHEIIRQRRRDLTLVRHVYDLHLIRGEYDAADIATLAREIMADETQSRAEDFSAYQAADLTVLPPYVSLSPG